MKLQHLKPSNAIDKPEEKVLKTGNLKNKL